MENDIKQHVLTFGEGITNTPSDLLCGDNSLEVCDGMYIKNGEFVPHQYAKEVFTLCTESGKTHKLLCIHKTNAHTNYIYGVKSHTETTVDVTLPVNYVNIWNPTKGVVQAKCSFAVASDIAISLRFTMDDDTIENMNFVLPRGEGRDAYTLYYNQNIKEIELIGGGGTNDGIYKYATGNVDSTTSGSNLNLDTTDTDTVSKTVYTDQDALDLYYYNGNSTKFGSLTGSVKSVDFIGNTLIVTTSDTINYYLWRQSGSTFAYKNLGSSLPSPQCDFRMINNPSANAGEQSTTIKLHTSTGCEYGELLKDDIDAATWIGDNNIELGIAEGSTLTDVENCFIGAMREVENKVKKLNMFTRPFLVCVALELYDGTFYKIGNPIPMFPSLTDNVVFANKRCSALCGEIYYNLETDYSDWSDIVRGVVVFATDDVELYESSMKEYVDADGAHYAKKRKGTDAKLSGVYGGFIPTSTGGWNVLVNRNAEDIKADIEGSSVFYRLFDIGLKDSGWKSSRKKMKKNVVTNLTTQQRLDVNDYYSHCPIVPVSTGVYNNRLMLLGVKRGFFEGFKHQFSYIKSDSAGAISGVTADSVTVVVTIDTPSGTRYVQQSLTTKDILGLKTWFYYPDPRAKRVQISNGNICILDAVLTEHSGLNGAYYFRGVPVAGEKVTHQGATSSAKDVTPEELYNHLFQSEAGNPFVFTAASDITMGCNNIIAAKAITTPLSQGQYGQYPLVIFTDNGLWSANISSEGRITNFPPSFSREVCINPKSIVVTSNSIFFASNRGLMVIGGTTDTSVKCVSERLGGIGFNVFMGVLKDCVSSYDSKEGLIYLCTEGFGADGVFTFNTNNSTWSRPKSLTDNPDGKFLTAVGNYPDYILEDEDGKCYSYLDKPNRECDGNRYDAHLSSRPMKLEGAMLLKSMRQIKHLKCFDRESYTVTITPETGGEGGEGHDDTVTPMRTAGVTVSVKTLKFSIYGSNDLKSWNELESVKGKAWRYFKFVYTFNQLRATDTFTGTVCVTQTRHTDKVR